jgi:hypothetical protein
MGDPGVITLAAITDDLSIPTTVVVEGNLTSNGSTAVFPGTLSLAFGDESTRIYTTTGNTTPPGTGSYFKLTVDTMGALLDYFLNGSVVASWGGGDYVSLNPEDYTFVPLSSATGTPTITNGEPISASFIGQLCRVGTSSPYSWFRAAETNPTVWEEN